ncbi:MAG TPA: luciferase family protein [Candidatus Bathyarchaeia archaeon]|nr:luciferase family protein [Candidatus Bathyarchaeia archaeon]
MIASLGTSRKKTFDPDHVEKIRATLLQFRGISIGRKFGGEAFFFRKRFFCHFHPAKDHFFLETLVWNRVSDVVKQVPGVIPHPEYGNYGWVRLPILSESDVTSAMKLVEITYRILRTTRRVSIRKENFSPDALDLIRNELKHLTFKVKEAKKVMQILIEVHSIPDYDEADSLLEKAVALLKN